jgi:hypothetical protein
MYNSKLHLAVFAIFVFCALYIMAYFIAWLGPLQFSLAMTIIVILILISVNRVPRG